jgi:hypothetical protein
MKNAAVRVYCHVHPTKTAALPIFQKMVSDINAQNMILSNKLRVAQQVMQYFEVLNP